MGVKDAISKTEFYSRLADKAYERRVPLMATLELTYGCNMRCVHCYNPTHEAQGELTAEEFYRILDQLAEEGCLFVTFTGGELFTRKDAFEIFAYAKGKGFELILFTNATTITVERAERIKALQPWRMETSLYGATQETYERVTRIPGSFRQFQRGVELLRQRDIPLLVKMPLLTLNRHEVAQAKALVEGWGVRFVYLTGIEPRQDGSREPLGYRLPPAEVLKVNEEMRGKESHDRHEETSCQASEGLFHCRCGKNSLAITPYGEMNLCINFPVPRYDLRRGNVSTGWRTLVAYVDSAKPSEAYECPSCDLRSDCRQSPLDAWLETKDLSPCLPYFKELATLEKEKGSV